MKYVLAVMILAAPVQQDARVQQLIDRLVDDDIVVRDQAAAELADYGKAVVPALEKLKSSPDVELRSRAASVLKAIGEMEIVGLHWHRGARISFEFSAVPLAKVLEELQRQGRDKFKINAAELKEPVSVRVQDASFWEALEAVGRAAPDLNWEVEGDLIVFSRKRRPPYPGRRQGEFSVWLDSIVFTRDNDFTGIPRSTYTLSLSAAWEAGIAPIAVDQKITEVLDEDGTNLISPDRFGYGGRLDTPKGRLRKDGVFIPVAPGGKTAKKFSRVRGTSTFYFPRSYEEVQIDLRAAPVPVVFDRVSVVVRNFRVVKGGVACEVVMTVAMGSNDGMIDRLPFSELSIVDDQGGFHRSPTSSRSHSYSGTAYTIHENLQVPFPEGRTAVGLKMRVLKDVLEKRIAFEFDDIAVE
jgi:hypothetical protein